MTNPPHDIYALAESILKEATERLPLTTSYARAIHLRVSLEQHKQFNSGDIEKAIQWTLLKTQKLE